MLIVWIVAAGFIPTAKLSPETLREWQVRSALIEQHALSSKRKLQVNRGDLVVKPISGGTEKVPGGLLHHWVGATLVPGARASEVVRRMQQYGDYGKWYAPDLLNARVLAQDGEHYRIAMRFREQKVVTVTLDGVADVYWSANSSVSHMDEVRDESGEDHGFLWRMNTYWRFEQASDGVFLECEVVSLTRDVPQGLGWLVTPFLSSVPRDSLQFTLEKTRHMWEAGNGDSNTR